MNKYNSSKSVLHPNVKTRMKIYAILNWNRPIDENEGNLQRLR
jgi:hypothetical protein